MSAQAFDSDRARLAGTTVSITSLDRARQDNSYAEDHAEPFILTDNFGYP